MTSRESEHVYSYQLDTLGSWQPGTQTEFWLCFILLTTQIQLLLPVLFHTKLELQQFHSSLRWVCTSLHNEGKVANRVTACCHQKSCTTLKAFTSKLKLKSEWKGELNIFGFTNTITNCTSLFLKKWSIFQHGLWPCHMALSRHISHCSFLRPILLHCSGRGPDE